MASLPNRLMPNYYR
ncbi:unnamed protein product [Lathyrus oleraceus]